jgi:hypothetical protein
VDWCDLVWFHLAIPRQTFFMWLAFKIVFLLVIGCYVGVLLVIAIVFFAIIVFRVEIIFSLSVASAVVLGDLLRENTVLHLVVCNDIMDFSLRNWKSKSLAASVCKLS